ncbi:hypothetical protein TU57_10440 [Bacillus cereus]|uniref:hypothetical protein n=1 Tax=Bacillus cereus group TaxID=86661 RepID=UPI00065C09A5|nr:hypothetical protein [Bacillus cereus]KMP65163.1 hypothetical protein TU57_10440 [Bacillus cereus]
MKKRNRLFLEKKAEFKKNEKHLKGLKKGQGRIISNNHSPYHYHEIGAVVDITGFRVSGVDCYDSKEMLEQTVNPKDIVIKQ